MYGDRNYSDFAEKKKSPATTITQKSARRNWVKNVPMIRIIAREKSLLHTPYQGKNRNVTQLQARTKLGYIGRWV